MHWIQSLVGSQEGHVASVGREHVLDTRRIALVQIGGRALALVALVVNVDVLVFFVDRVRGQVFGQQLHERFFLAFVGPRPRLSGHSSPRRRLLAHVVLIPRRRLWPIRCIRLVRHRLVVFKTLATSFFDKLGSLGVERVFHRVG